MTTTHEVLGPKSDQATSSPVANTGRATILRPATVTDLKALASLDKAVFNDVAYSLVDLTSLYLVFRKTWCVAEHKGKLAGYALVCPDSDNSEVWLMGLAVNDTYRGRGLGRTLMTRAMNLMMKSGASDAYITVRPDNEAARYLYEEFEFAPEGGEHENFYGNGEPRLVYHRSLVKNPYDADPA